MKFFLNHTISLCLLFTPVASLAHGPIGKVKGTVKGLEGALQGATVSADNRRMMTDKNGEFIFPLKAGTHQLVITHAGYKKNITEIKIEVQQTIILDFIMSPIDQLGEVVVLGSRSVLQRSNLNTPVPVDAISSNQLKQTGQPSLTQMLNFAVPSLNISRQLLNESITLRGLNPDQTLILLNNTRYHNMAYPQPTGIRGMLGRGAVSNDINSIPFSAIRKIEILRDGASAQYGSDAIAGVLNISLKESTGKTSIDLHTGQFYKGDGENISFGINHGISLNKRGFLNFSADARLRNHTYRGGEFRGTVYNPGNPVIDDSVIKARNFDRNKVSNAGDTKLRSIALLVNGGYLPGKKTKLFWTAAFNKRESTFIGIYLLPKNSRQLNNLLYPDGTKTNPIQNSHDVSLIAGAKGETQKNWHWEYSSSYGSNNCRYNPENTNNASQFYTLGKNAPTKFYAGSLIYRQWSNNIHISKQLNKKNTTTHFSNIGYGFEWRLENYEISAGEEAAWQNYDPLGRKLGGVQNSLIFHPENVLNKHRNVWGAYLDLEKEFINHVLIDIAGRYEYYDDFGGNIAGKIAFRYKIADRLSLRGSASNGFRAPALQQRYFNSTVNGVGNVNGIVVPGTTGFYHNHSAVANALGIPSLNAERSVNMSAGFTVTLLNRINLTADAYWIQVKNRIVLSDVFIRADNKNIDSILKAHNIGVDRLHFFANAINTRTKGIDVIANSKWKIKKAFLEIMLGMNFTQTRLFGDVKVAGNLKPDSLNTNTIFGRLERTRVEKGQPGHKIILALNYKTGRFELLLRNTHFGKTGIASVAFPNDPSLDEVFYAKLLTDISMTWHGKKWLSITAGINNVFNVYPDRLKNLQNTGEGQFIYAQESSPFGFNGGYYYVSMSFNF